MAASDKKNEGGQARNWYKDRYETVVTQRNFLGTIALVSLTLALIAGIVIMLLIPSKTVMPLLIQVDDKSGTTIMIDQKSQNTIAADEALRKYFVVKFVKSREGYDSADIDINMNTVRLMADRSIYRIYLNEVISPNNKDSLYVKLAADKMRQVKIRSVQFLDANRAQVRLVITDSVKASGSGRSLMEKQYIALVKFQFDNVEMKPDDLIVNPLGFHVTEYKLDEYS